jgi:protein-L-isoaspartate O-methyltransferase
MGASARRILWELESLLKSLPEQSVVYEDVHDADYIEQFTAYREMGRDEQKSIHEYVVDRICQHLEKGSREPLRVCSVGCADGMTDKVALTEVSGKYPDAIIDFVGIEINPKSCSRAKKNLSGLPYNVTIVNKDLMEIDAESIEKFDLVILSHVIYYFKQLKPLFDKLFKICKDKNGDIDIEVIVDRGTPQWAMATLFFEKERKFPYRFSPAVMKEFDRMGLTYSSMVLPGQVDLRSCVKDKFTSQVSKNILDFICQTKLDKYPPQVRQLCIEYITALYNGDDGKCERFDTSIAITITMKQ